MATHKTKKQSMRNLRKTS